MIMKRLIANIIVVMLLFNITINLMGCTIKASYYTEEQHIQRITERIEKQRETWNWMYPEGETYSDFKVYPLYDENDEFIECLVEFEPYGFFIALIGDLHIISYCFKGSMYGYSEMYGAKENKHGHDLRWSPYKYDKYYSYDDKIWILDEKGERIYYDKSPYFVTGNINEKKYLIDINDGAQYICAIKKDGQFVNLISGEMFDGHYLQNQPTIYFGSVKINEL